MGQQTQNLLSLAEHELQAGNYAKALVLSESALGQSPTHFIGWLIKACCEAHLQTGDMAGWESCHASLLQADRFAFTSGQKQKTAVSKPQGPTTATVTAAAAKGSKPSSAIL